MSQHYDIDTLLDEVVTLPSMPTSLEQVTRLMNDPNSSLSDVAKAISADPSISLKTLRLVNSAYYGLGQEVKTVDHAVVLLGGKVVKNLVVSATVFDAIEGSAERFILHTVGCGVAMRSLYKQPALSSALESADEGFVFGLLHEIGRVLLAEYMPKECDEIEALIAGGTPAYLAEREIIGVDHAEIGAKLAERWRLSETIIGALSGQYNIDRCPEQHRVLAAFLQLANFLCEASGYSSEELATAVLEDEALALTGITPDTLPAVLQAFYESRREIDELFSLSA
ncbi:MAG: HDOD domain-containing protein [Candidatus Hydrogenedens sp.]|nr:HDOD domain-containing protein [Candidatus Hydrogenedens sp.]